MFSGEKVIFIIWALEEIEINKWKEHWLRQQGLSMVCLDTITNPGMTSRPKYHPENLDFPQTACNLIPSSSAQNSFPTCLSFSSPGNLLSNFREWTKLHYSWYPITITASSPRSSKLQCLLTWMKKLNEWVNDSSRAFLILICLLP